MNYKLEYEEQTGTLWVMIDGIRYFIAQASGELIAAHGHNLSDYYWSNPPETCQNVKSLLWLIAASLKQ